jgi:hypothetical protein
MISESQERMVASCARRCSPRVEGSATGGSCPCAVDRRGHGRRAAPRAPRRLRSSARSLAPPDRRVPTLRRRAETAGVAHLRSAPTRRRNRPSRSTSSTTSSSARAPCAGRGSTRRAAAAALAARARRLAAGTGAGETRPVPCGVERCSEPRATSPAPAASRSGSRIASTSATRRSRRSRTSSPRRSRASRGARGARIPVVSGNVSLYNDNRRPLDPADARRRLRRARPRRARRAVRVAARRRRAPRRGARGEPRGGGSPDPLPLEGRAASVALPRRRLRGSRGRSRRPRGGAARGGRRASGRARQGARSSPRLATRSPGLGSRGFVEIGRVR